MEHVLYACLSPVSFVYQYEFLFKLIWNDELANSFSLGNDIDIVIYVSSWNKQQTVEQWNA